MCLLLMKMSRSRGDVSTELIKDAIVRGRMCELVGDVARTATRRDIPSGGSLFLIGLFSHIDLLMGVPLETVIADIDVAPEVRAALLGREGKAGTILSGIEAYTQADWIQAKEGLAEVGVPPNVLADLYLDSLTWATSLVTLN